MTLTDTPIDLEVLAKAVARELAETTRAPDVAAVRELLNRVGIRQARQRVQKCRLTGKRIMTRRAAQREAAWWAKAWLHSTMNAYACRACGHWHVGHRAVTRNPRHVR